MSFNLEEETISGFLVTAERKRLWAIQMDIARELLDVCEKHHLRIWADGGTLLGAVRHKGFIPWDDDMDFAMMREDFETLKKIGPTSFHEPYFFQSFDTDNVFSGIIKIRRSDTAMIDSSYKIWKPRHYGIFVDVLVMDGIPDDQARFTREYAKLRNYQRLLTRKHVYRPDYHGWRSLLRALYVEAYFALHGGEKKVERRMVRMLSGNPIENNRYCAMLELDAQSPDGKVYYRDRSVYDETVGLPFHDMILPAPRKYDQFLRDRFGDYMTPVMGKQWHEILTVDTTRPYGSVLEDLLQRENK